ncbi:MAG: hypothetical protein V4714_04445 [Bacteroidota bacterium]
MDTTLINKFEEIVNVDKDVEKFEDEQQVTPYLRLVTGLRYCLATSNHRKWGLATNPVEEGSFYQIIPDKMDDGFFDWYCNNRPYHQFYKTAEMALLHFVFYWHVWKKRKQD